MKLFITDFFTKEPEPTTDKELNTEEKLQAYLTKKLVEGFVLRYTGHTSMDKYTKFLNALGELIVSEDIEPLTKLFHEFLDNELQK